MAAVGERYAPNVVENAAQQLRLAAVEHINGIIDLSCRRTVLPEYQKGEIRLVSQLLHIGEKGDWRRVDEDVVHFLPRLVQQRFHVLRRDQFRRTVAGIGGKQGVDAALFQILRLIGHRSLDLIRQFPRRLVGKQLVLRCLVEIRVDQQHLLVSLCQRQRQIGRHGGLALIFQHAGHKDHLSVSLLNRILELGRQLIDLFRKLEAGNRHGDQQPPVGLFQLAPQGLVLRLMVQRAEKLRIQLPPDGLGGLHRIRQEENRRQQQDHGGRAACKGGFCDLDAVDRVGRGHRHLRAVQLLQKHVLKNIFRDRIIIFQQDFQRLEGVRRGFRRDLQRQQVRLRDHGGPECSGQAGHAQLAAGNATEHIALKQLGKRVRDLRGQAQIGKH